MKKREKYDGSLNPSSEEIRSAVADKGHRVKPVNTVGGGINIVRFEAGGMLGGAACWRADGHAVGIGGGFARPGASFRPLAYGLDEPAQVDISPEHDPVPGESVESATDFPTDLAPTGDGERL
ncbi:MAG: hypothetical protein V3S56_06650 [Gemmatimonadota bacterium]